MKILKNGNFYRSALRTIQTLDIYSQKSSRMKISKSKKINSLLKS